ncbi:MAG: DUF4433 domain-containing protein [candidate division WOR-3 bacterium]|jgi:hypothetical protein
MNSQLEDIKLYRMTHIENIPHILQHGIAHKNSKFANAEYKNIGDFSLISARERKTINITNGNNNIIKTIILGDFIPFYFNVKMPMLYVIQHGGNFTTKTSSSDIVYLVCSLYKIVQLDNIECYFCDGHATDNLTTFYDSSFIKQIGNIIDWTAVTSQYWGGENNLEVKRKKQAEFLVKGDLPVEVIEYFICYDEIAEEKLKKFGVKSIRIDKNAYY